MHYLLQPTGGNLKILHCRGHFAAVAFIIVRFNCSSFAFVDTLTFCKFATKPDGKLANAGNPVPTSSIHALCTRTGLGSSVGSTMVC